MVNWFWSYAHAPPASAIVILLTIIVGIFRLVKVLQTLLAIKKKLRIEDTEF